MISILLFRMEVGKDISVSIHNRTLSIISEYTDWLENKLLNK